MRLPDFVIAGSWKSATSWLHDPLSVLPEIWMPAHTKELYFFDRYFDRGVEWYASYFSEAPRDRKVGEASPSYMIHPAASQRIRATNPTAKLVFSLRSPVDRA